MCPKKVRHKRVGIAFRIRASLAGIGRCALVKEKEKILKKRKS